MKNGRLPNWIIWLTEPQSTTIYATHFSGILLSLKPYIYCPRSTSAKLSDWNFNPLVIVSRSNLQFQVGENSSKWRQSDLKSCWFETIQKVKC